MKACNLSNLKIAMKYIFDLLVTINDIEWPLMTSSELKIAKLQLYVNQMKAINLGNLKIAMKYIFDLLVTPSDLL